MRQAWLDIAGRWRNGSSAGRWATAASVGVFAFVTYVIVVADGHFGDAPLFLLAVPMTLSAFAFGLRGGIGSTVVGSALATAWWVKEGYPGGATWYSSRMVTLVVLGVVLGRLVDSRRALLRALERHAEVSPDLIATASFDGYFTRVNPAFTRTLGYTQTEFLSRPFLDFIHPDDREATIREVKRQTEAGEEVLSFANRYLHKDGSYRWLEWTSHPEPSTRTLVAVARDVTERKLLEQREHDYQARLEREVEGRTAELHRRNAELEEARHEMLRRLALAAEYRDDETFKHTERVGQSSALIAVQLGLSEREIMLIREAAPLHDIGKLGVSDAVLLKPGRLSETEFAHVKRHAAAGAAILSGSSSDVLRMAEEIARHHHEWWDGTGYPNHLKGNAIPLAARIVSLADVFDALTHSRPYKEAWPIDRAVGEIHRLAGRQFDPQVVAAFDHLEPERLAELATDVYAVAVGAVA